MGWHLLPRLDSSGFHHSLCPSRFSLQEESFHLVDNRPVQRKQFGPRRFQPRQFNARGAGGRDTGGRDQGGGAERERLRRERQQSKKQQQWSTFQGGRGFGGPGPTLAPSVDIRPEWAVLEQLPLSALTKLSLEVGQPQDLVTAGALWAFDKTLDRLTPKTELALRRVPGLRPPQPTASDDPILRRLATEAAAAAKDEASAAAAAASAAAAAAAAAAKEAGEDGAPAAAPGPAKKAPVRVFATEVVLAALMCAPRSVYSWDVVLTREGNTSWLDRRNGSPLDRLTVNETAQEAGAQDQDKDSINAVDKLSSEATAVNAAYARQAVVGTKKVDYPAADPFTSAAADPSVPPVAYRYRQWKVDESTVLTARCELQAAVEYKGEDLVAVVKALNEFDSKVSGIDWRQKIETQRGAVLANELKNNANKLATWTCSALLAGADQLKLGYVSRTHPKDSSSHVILATQTHKPRDFAAQINLGINNMWGILKCLVDLCRPLPDGKYILVKDPLKPLLRLYEVPPGTLQAGDYADAGDA